MAFVSIVISEGQLREIVLNLWFFIYWIVDRQIKKLKKIRDIKELL